MTQGCLIPSLVAAPLLTAIVSCAASKSIVSSTTSKPLSAKIALRLAGEAIELEGGSPLTPKQLVAMALQESSLVPDAIGDHGKAVGLFQFHKGTWADHTNGTGWQREMPLESFRVAIRYAKRGSRLLARSPNQQDRRVERLWSHHNVGNIRKVNERYVNAVYKRYSDLNAGRIP